MQTGPIQGASEPALRSCGRAPAGARVVVQQRQRLLREGISQLLSAEDDVEVVALATTDGEVVAACREQHPSAALIEADACDWDPLRLAATLARVAPGVAVIGLSATPLGVDATNRARRAGMGVVVSRGGGMRGILEAVRAPAGTNGRERQKSICPPSHSFGTAPSPLTSRELEILSLVGGGLTSKGVSNRLHISHKTVENHKQRIFAKLGVQNQAHAVSVAMRTGLMRPERVVDLAAGD